MSNKYYERKAELKPFTTARSDDVRNEFDGIQSAFEKLPTPREDGQSIGFISNFTIIAPTDPSHPAQKAQVDTEHQKNEEQDGRLDNLENFAGGIGPTSERYTTLRYVATASQDTIVLPAQFNSLASVYINGDRVYQTVRFTYDVPTKTITFTPSLSLNDEVLVDVGLVPDVLLADLLAIQKDIADRQADVTQKQDDVTQKQSDVTSKHNDVNKWQQQVSQDKNTTVSAKDETLATYHLLQKLHLGSHATEPTVDNEGNPLIEGATYYNSTNGKSYVYEQGAWVVTNLSALTTVAKTSPSGKAHLPVGTSAEGGTPDKGAVRYDDDNDEFVGGNGTEWGSIGGGGVPKFIYKSADFTVEKRKAYAVDMADDVTKTISVPDGLANNDWFAVKILNWTGARGVHCFVSTTSDEWEPVNSAITALTRKMRISQNAIVYIQKIRGKWSVVDGIGESGSGMPFNQLVQEDKRLDGIIATNKADVDLYRQFKNTAIDITGWGYSESANVFFSRIGNQVHAYVTLNKVTQAVATRTKIVDIPEGYRPLYYSEHMTNTLSGIGSTDVARVGVGHKQDLNPNQLFCIEFTIVRANGVYYRASCSWLTADPYPA